MSRFLVRRLLLLVPVLMGVSVIVFLVLHLAPGDPAEIMLGSQATQADRARLRADLGLDDPLHVQYARWLGHVVQGDLGRSLWMRRRCWARSSSPQGDVDLDATALVLFMAGGVALFPVLDASQLWSSHERRRFAFVRHAVSVWASC